MRDIIDISVAAKKILLFNWIAVITLSSEIIINLWLHGYWHLLLQTTWGPRALIVWSSALFSCRLLIPACLHTILYHLLFLCLYHSFDFTTHVGLCPPLLTFSLDKFTGSPTHSTMKQQSWLVGSLIFEPVGQFEAQCHHHSPVDSSGETLACPWTSALAMA